MVTPCEIYFFKGLKTYFIQDSVIFDRKVNISNPFYINQGALLQIRAKNTSTLVVDPKWLYQRKKELKGNSGKV